jgi:hypothetical protein
MHPLERLLEGGEEVLDVDRTSGVGGNELGLDAESAKVVLVIGDEASVEVPV